MNLGIDAGGAAARELGGESREAGSRRQRVGGGTSGWSGSIAGCKWGSRRTQLSGVVLATVVVAAAMLKIVV